MWSESAGQPLTACVELPCFAACIEAHTCPLTHCVAGGPRAGGSGGSEAGGEAAAQRERCAAGHSGAAVAGAAGCRERCWCTGGSHIWPAAPWDTQHSQLCHPAAWDRWLSCARHSTGRWGWSSCSWQQASYRSRALCSCPTTRWPHPQLGGPHAPLAGHPAHVGAVQPGE